MTRDIAKLRELGKSEIDRIKTEEFTRLLEAGAENVAPATSLAHVRDYILPVFADADYLAAKCQRAHIWDLRVVYVLAPFATFMSCLYLLMPHVSQWWGRNVAHSLELGFSIAECVALIIVVVRYQSARLGASHRHWVEFRFLAEMLRGAAVMVLAGLRPPVSLSNSESVDWTLLKYSETITTANRTSDPVGRPASSTYPVTSAQRFLINAWLVPQRRFHETRSSRYAKSGARSGALALLVFVVSLGSALGSLLFGLNGLDQSAFRFGSLFLPAAGAAIAAYSGLREFERLSEKSGNHARELSIIQNELLSANLSPEEFQRLAMELHRTVVDEVKNWRFLVKFSELRL